MPKVLDRAKTIPFRTPDERVSVKWGSTDWGSLQLKTQPPVPADRAVGNYCRDFTVLKFPRDGKKIGADGVVMGRGARCVETVGNW